jgi:tripartite-type tricarboxylate transporter receptor subunit TctC
VGAVHRAGETARRWFLSIRCILTTVVLIWPAASFPQTPASSAYPNKPVRYVVTFAAGSAPDTVARLLAERLTRIWGQQVIVDNRVGVSGLLGAAYVAKSPPDGYTLVQCNIGTNAIAVSLYANVPFDQIRDFAPVTRIGTTPNVIVVHPSVPFRTIKQMVAYAKANPGKLSYAAGFAGTSQPLMMDLFKLTEKINIVHIPYKAGPQAVTDNIGGQVPIGVYQAPSVVAQIQGGRLRGLTVSSAKRIAQLSAVPTMIESGWPDFIVTSWYGVCAPAATPVPVLDKLNADFGTVLRNAELQQRLDELVVQSSPTSREEFGQYIRAEITRWAQVIKDAGIPQQ